MELEENEKKERKLYLDTVVSDLVYNKIIEGTSLKDVCKFLSESNYVKKDKSTNWLLRDIHAILRSRKIKGLPSVTYNDIKTGNF